MGKEGGFNPIFENRISEEQIDQMRKIAEENAREKSENPPPIAGGQEVPASEEPSRPDMKISQEESGIKEQIEEGSLNKKGKNPDIALTEQIGNKQIEDRKLINLRTRLEEDKLILAKELKEEQFISLRFINSVRYRFECINNELINKINEELEKREKKENGNNVEFYENQLISSKIEEVEYFIQLEIEKAKLKTGNENRIKEIEEAGERLMENVKSGIERVKREGRLKTFKFPPVSKMLEKKINQLRKEKERGINLKSKIKPWEIRVEALKIPETGGQNLKTIPIQKQVLLRNEEEEVRKAKAKAKAEAEAEAKTKAKAKAKAKAEARAKAEAERKLLKEKKQKEEQEIEDQRLENLAEEQILFEKEQEEAERAEVELEEEFLINREIERFRFLSQKLEESRNELAKFGEKDPGYQEALAKYKIARDNSKNFFYKTRQIELKKSGLPSQEIEKQTKKHILFLYEKFYLNEALELQKRRLEIKAEAQKDRWVLNGLYNLGDKYKKLDWKYKVGLSLGLMGGAATFGTGGLAITTLFAIATAGQRVLGGLSTTVISEAFIKTLQEKRRVKKGITQKAIISKLQEEIEKALEQEKEKELKSMKLLEILNQKGDDLNNQLNDLAKREKRGETIRCVLAGTAGVLFGSGAIATALDFWGGESTTDISDTVKPGHINTTNLPTQEQGVPFENSGFVESEKPVPTHTPESPSNSETISIPDEISTKEVAPTTPAETPKQFFTLGEIKIEVPKEPLKIGSRGPEGAIIDYLKTQGFSVDEAGKQAHRIFSEFMDSEEVKNFMKEKGIGESEYNELMRHIKGGKVVITSDGKMKLIDMEYIKSAIAKTGGAIIETAKEKLSLPEEVMIDLKTFDNPEEVIENLEETVEESTATIQKSYEIAEDVFYNRPEEFEKVVDYYDKLEQELAGQFGEGYINIPNVIEADWEIIKNLSNLSKEEYGVIKDLKVKDFLNKTYWGMTEETKLPVFGERDHLELWRKTELRDRIKEMLSRLPETREIGGVKNLTVHQFLKEFYIKPLVEAAENKFQI